MKRFPKLVAVVSLAILVALALAPQASSAAEGGQQGQSGNGTKLVAQASKKKVKKAKAKDDLETVKNMNMKLKNAKFKQLNEFLDDMAGTNNGNIHDRAKYPDGMVCQSDASTFTVTVEWSKPAIAYNGNAEMYQYRVWWRQVGKSKWSGPAVVSAQGTSWEYTATGLEAGVEYEVRVGYRYKIKGDSGGYINIDDWKTCKAMTFLPGTEAPAGWDYSLTGYKNNGSQLQMYVSLVKRTENHWYEFQVNAGPKFDAERWNSANGWGTFNSGSLANARIESKGSSAYLYYNRGELGSVSTVGIRDVFRYKVPDPNTGSNPLGYRYKTVYGPWSTRTLVADPYFELTGGAYPIVKIPPLKYAQSYTVYIGKFKSGAGVSFWGPKEMKVKGWKKVGTVRAKSKGSVKVRIKKYGKKKIAGTGGKWAVKVVTHSKYGDSPGRYWQSWS